ncbi:MAG TPA: hypothetical protein VHZ55_03255 [Bryobacteraceae bacterium]|jgi:hypothetical protein|nr:hypothetical protein [Bryobacteraceae bacterium]
MPSPKDASVECEAGAISGESRWSILTRFVFRFAFVYFLLYCLPYSGRPSLLETIPLRGKPGEFVANASIFPGMHSAPGSRATSSGYRGPSLDTIRLAAVTPHSITFRFSVLLF